VAKISVMADQTGSSDAPRRIRPARGADLAHIAPIENAGDPQFADHFGEAARPALLGPAVDGWERVGRPGFLLVADDGAGTPVGFVHVLEIDGHAHLEQVSVHPDHQHRGVGAALVRAAMAEARARGFPRLSLCTFRDVPWNGPFYRRLGFTEVVEPAPFLQEIRRSERDLGLDAIGVRCVMEVALG